MTWWKISNSPELCIWKSYKDSWIQSKFHSMRILIETTNKAIWMPKTYRFNVCLNMKDWRWIKRKKFIRLIVKPNKKKKKLISVLILIFKKIYKILVIKMNSNKTKIEEEWRFLKMMLTLKMQALMEKKKKIRHSMESM